MDGISSPPLSTLYYGIRQDGDNIILCDAAKFVFRIDRATVNAAVAVALVQRFRTRTAKSSNLGEMRDCVPAWIRLLVVSGRDE
jgi:hypothetical protein